MPKILYQISIILSSFLVIVSLVLPSFVFAQKSSQVPTSIGEAQSFALKILERLPETMKKVWKEEALPILQKMWNWLKPKIEPLWQRELEKRKPVLEEEFQKERKEIEKDLFERLKNLLK